MILEQSELGKNAAYDSQYDPSKLFAFPRKIKREEVGIFDKLPFYGFDLWNHYEVSWLNEKGKPVVALAEIIYSCDSESIIESKSMKLYFNSFNNTHFKDVSQVQAVIQRDLAVRIKGSVVTVRIIPIELFTEDKLSKLTGICLDELDVACSVYHTEPNFLVTANELVTETVYSHLLKSNCLMTSQPDWCSVQITYQGKKINHAGLLQYIVSFRNENEFHEPCIEKIFMHIMQRCQPTDLTVFGWSTRRGGVDINSKRSTRPIDPNAMPNSRLCRQ